MRTLLTKASRSIRSFARDEQRAQMVEYALVIAVVSIILVALRDLTGTSFSDFIIRVDTCLTMSASCA
jgi:pilus assembly protein Flp/PilA